MKIKIMQKNSKERLTPNSFKRDFNMAVDNSKKRSSGTFFDSEEEKFFVFL